MDNEQVVPFRQLSKKALQAAIEAFVLRQSGDFDSSLSMAQKILRVQYLLDSGRAKVVVNPTTKIHSVVKVAAS